MNVFLTVDIKHVKILKNLKEVRNFDEVYIKTHKQLLIDYWNVDISEFEVKQIFWMYYIIMTNLAIVCYK